MKHYINCINNFFESKGRTRRKEFWMFMLFNCIFFVLAGLLDYILGLQYDFITLDGFMIKSGKIENLYFLFSLIPTITAAVRRLHDSNKTGKWVFIWFVPLFGQIFLLIFMCLDGDKGDNKYGPDPKEKFESFYK